MLEEISVLQSARRVVTSTLVVLALSAAPGLAEMDPHLEPLKPLVGKTWRGTLPNGAIDVHRFELVLGGQAVRSLHSVNDGVYGGEAIIVWDSEKQCLVSHYFTTGGFYTVGTFRIEDGWIVSHEIVHGNAGAVREVKGRSRVADGKLVVRTEQLKNGEWVPGGERFYVEDPAAVVRFKE
jgi:hypothetical protein